MSTDNDEPSILRHMHQLEPSLGLGVAPDFSALWQPGASKSQTAATQLESCGVAAEMRLEVTQRTEYQRLHNLHGK